MRGDERGEIYGRVALGDGWSPEQLCLKHADKSQRVSHGVPCQQPAAAFREIIYGAEV